MADFIDSKVIIPGQSRGYGILKYVGPISGKAGTFGGIELQGPVAASRGKNSGAVDGIQYFQVSQPMTGLFLPWERLRSVNSKLPRLDDAGTRSSSIASGEILQAPSPPTRGGSRFSSFGRQEPLALNSGRESPYLQNVGLAVSKRGTSRPPTSASSRSDLGETVSRPNTEMLLLRAELASTKAQLELHLHELREKNEILLELQRTVDELNPILGDYENSLSEKDRKLQKQRQEYDRAREEWRQSLDLMLSAQQQAESLYEQQIEDLKEEIEAVKKSGGSLGDASGVSELKLHLQSVEAENDALRQELREAKEAKATTTTETKPAEVDDELLETLNKKIDRLTQDVTSTEIVLQQSQQQNRAKDARIAELEIELDELKEERVDEVLKNVLSLSVSDWQESETQFKRQISQLKELEAVYKKMAEKLASQVTELESQNLDLKKQLAELKNQVTELKTQVAELEKQVAEQGKENEVLQPKNSGLLDKLSLLESDLNSSKKLVDTQSKKIEELEKNIEYSVAREKALNELTKLSDPSEELLRKIEDLKHELDMRPSFDELTELQNSLDDVERLHRNEVYLKEKDLSSLQEEYNKLEKEKEALSKKLESLRAEKILATPVQLSPTKNTISTGSASLPDPEVWVKNDGLAVYTPPQPSDPSSGRSNWCGLCERDGHSSLNCPYENDIF